MSRNYLIIGVLTQLFLSFWYSANGQEVWASSAVASGTMLFWVAVSIKDKHDER